MLTGEVFEVETYQDSFQEDRVCLFLTNNKAVEISILNIKEMIE